MRCVLKSARTPVYQAFQLFSLGWRFCNGANVGKMFHAGALASWFGEQAGAGMRFVVKPATFAGMLPSCRLALRLSWAGAKLKMMNIRECAQCSL